MNIGQNPAIQKFLGNGLLIFIFTFWGQTVLACPACFVSQSNRFDTTRLLLLAIMGIFPVFLASWVGYKIYDLCRGQSKAKKK